MQSCELVVFVTSIACAISKNYSPDELSVISAIFSQLGDTIATIQAQEEACNARLEAKSEEKSSE